MKIVTIQLAAELGRFQANLLTAEELLKGINASNVDLLVLPELAFSGYNFPDIRAITPYLEPTAAGPSTEWARRIAKRLSCVVIIGYPELFKCQDPTDPSSPRLPLDPSDYNVEPSPAFPPLSSQTRYNSTVMLGPTGDVIGHYRKTCLFTTDETWASEGSGFWEGRLPLEPPLKSQEPMGSGDVKVAHGICMDINPYKFEAPWEKYEYANHCLDVGAQLVINVNAFLTSPSDVPDDTMEPDMHTLAYWIARHQPLLLDDKEVVIVCANRSGKESDATYAGSSTVMKVGKGEVWLWRVLGKGEEGVLAVDTNKEPRLKMVEKKEEREEVMAMADEKVEEMVGNGGPGG